MLRPRSAIGCLAAAFAAGAAGCGGDDDEPGRTVTVEAGPPLTVTADEYSYDPERVVVRARARRALTFLVRNGGALAHDLRVEREGDDIGGTPVFTPGGARTLSIALRPGRYELYCSVGNHRDLGMEGSLEVR
jgi:hypothetical protein